MINVLSFNLLYASGAEPVQPRDPDSWDNAGSWEQRRPLVGQIVRRHEPDFVGFQEVQEQPMRDLRALLDGYGCHEGPVNGVDRLPTWSRWALPPLVLGSLLAWQRRQSVLATLSLSLAAILGGSTVMLRRAKGNAIENGGRCPIFYREDRWTLLESGTFWLSHRPDQPDTVFPGTWLPRICNWAKFQRREDGRRLTLLNAHLDWWILSRRRAGTLMGERMNELWDESPQILMGDFNSPWQSVTCQSLREVCGGPEEEPIDAWHEAERRHGPLTTYHGGNGEPNKWPGRLDHILIRPPLRVLEVVTVEARDGHIQPSDHFPVLAKLEY